MRDFPTTVMLRKDGVPANRLPEKWSQIPISLLPNGGFLEMIMAWVANTYATGPGKPRCG